MPTVQTDYLDNIPAGYAGAIANEEPRTLISREVETVAGIGFGKAVMQGSDDFGCIIGDGSEFLGVTVRDQSVDPAAPDLFERYASARIMTKGVIWVINTGGVEAGDPVSLEAAGGFGTGGSVEIDGARWDTSAETGLLAQLRLA